MPLKYFKKAAFLLALGGLIMTTNPSKATHNVGMEMYYECIDASTNFYQVTLKSWRWCEGNPYSDSIFVAIYDTLGNLVNGPLGLQMQLPNSSLIDTLSNETPGLCLFPPSPPNVCVEQAIYEGLWFLPSFDPGGYHITFQQCCRNGTIDNIDLWNGQAGTSLFVTKPPDNIASCNSSVQYDQYPPTTICMDDTFIYEHSAFDPDGDSIVYALCSATDGDFTDPSTGSFNAHLAPSKFIDTFFDVGYTGTGYAYSATDPIYAPNLPLTIDPHTGILTCLPEQEGQYLITVCAYEYRNGELLSINRREFQLNVVACTNSISSDFYAVQDTNLTVNFINNSAYGSSYFWNFGVTNQINDTSSLHSPSYTYAHPGTYNVTLIVNMGMWCADTLTLAVTVVDNPTTVINNPWMDNTHMAIYPNPTSGKLAISGDKGTTEVYDMYGRKVLQTNSSHIDLSNEPPGIYFVQLTNDEGRRYIKKVVKH